ncbi:MAG: DUF3800 domain-containing protein [Pseudomonas sp.]|uniref:DUF3800 domain-containing protein n=1 Tax=Pseudomonas sp. TaxID=306 RepID=UPI00271B92DF|nr:DUF3800 domain-containing protein [Pseudomonas sp.]MDO9618349.1 DUF3800 domain-containing protein [Pseudomonas sp.]MDP2445968.1 DUF3800 domain-containing protein [Pseudomonas sp.]MDZ4333421.1 DUF3800 domain-containing protein [Pseudomonas sp.]
MLEAYIDDSASDFRADKRLILAGYLQSAEAWERLTEDWTAELARPPALASLHMITCFQGWSEKAREAKINSLVAVLAKYKPLSIECSISRAAYLEDLSGSVPYDLRHPYFPCFVGIMHGVVETVLEEKLEGPVELIFDEQGKVGEDAALWYVPLKHMNPAVADVLGGPPRFASDHEVVPLQAADMLAWYVRRAAETRCTARQREVADALRFRHRHMEIPDSLVMAWSEAFQYVPGIEHTKGRRGSTSKLMRELVARLPSDRVVPALKKITRRATWLRRARSTFMWLGLERIWKRLAHRKFTIR